MWKWSSEVYINGIGDMCFCVIWIYCHAAQPYLLRRDILAFFTLIPHDMYSKNEMVRLVAYVWVMEFDPWVKSWSEEYKPRGNSRGRLRASLFPSVSHRSRYDVWQPATSRHTVNNTHKSHDVVKDFLDKLISLAQEEDRLERTCLEVVMYLAN